MTSARAFGAYYPTVRSPLGRIVALFWTVLPTAAADLTKTVCEYAVDCEEQHQCIDSRCMCDPRWAHKGLKCDELRWNSWAMTVILTSVSVASVSVLVSAAKKLSKESPKRCSGLAALVNLFLHTKGEDAGSATIRAVLASAAFDLVSYGWMVLTATGVISDSTSAFWEARLVLPISGGLMILPTATVVSVWMGLSTSSASRAKAMAKVRRTKIMLQVGTGLYVLALFLLCMSGHSEHAEVGQLGAIGIGLNACGSGAAKLCNKLRAAGGNSVGIADMVFKVSRSMGICLYAMFCGSVLLLSSDTRKSDPANLALAGTTVYSLAKCFLNKAIFEYLVESVRAKEARLHAASQRNKMALSSPASEKSSMHHRVARGRGDTVYIGAPLSSHGHDGSGIRTSAIADNNRLTERRSKMAEEAKVEEMVIPYEVPSNQS